MPGEEEPSGWMFLFLILELLQLYAALSSSGIQ